jgi:hypothetical protein
MPDTAWEKCLEASGLRRLEMDTNRSRHGLTLAVLFAATVVFAGAPAALADQIVYFQNGKAITVKSVEKGDKLTILEMDGGGKIGVPTAQIVRIEDYLVTANGAVPGTGVAVPTQSAPIAAAPPANAPAQAIAVTQPADRAIGTGFGGAPPTTAEGGRIPAPLAVGNQGQGVAAGPQIKPRYPMSPLQGLARAGADGRMETPVTAGPGAGRQMRPFGMLHGRGNERGVAPGAYGQNLTAIQAAQAQAAQLRAAHPQAPPAPPPATAPADDEPGQDPATVDTNAAPDDPAGAPEDSGAETDTPDDASSVEN